MEEQTKYYYCKVCKQPQTHSFSSECCGAIVVNKKGDIILNVLNER